jgi:hypothetical protein
MSTWSTVELPANKTRHWSVGPLDFWIQHDAREWRVVSGTGADEFAMVCDDLPKPDDKEWMRWALETKAGRVRLAPVLPDRSLIARPQSTICIPPRQEARFFVSVPLWVRIIVVESEKENVLTDLPTLELSNSWYGTPVEGELCYALRTRARRTQEEIESKPFRAICPVKIRNEAEIALNFERLCISARFLDIYQGKKHMWTSEGTVVYSGEEASSQVTFGKTAPPFDDAKAAIGKARDEAKHFMLRSFGNLKTLAFG